MIFFSFFLKTMIAIAIIIGISYLIGLRLTKDLPDD